MGLGGVFENFADVAVDVVEVALGRLPVMASEAVRDDECRGVDEPIHVAEYSLVIVLNVDQRGRGCVCGAWCHGCGHPRRHRGCGRPPFQGRDAPLVEGDGLCLLRDQTGKGDHRWLTVCLPRSSVMANGKRWVAFEFV